MFKIDGFKLLNSIHPDFFNNDYVKNMPKEIYHEEMILPLKDFEEGKYSKALNSDITFGFYEGDMDLLYEAIRDVNKYWVEFFTKEQRIYCAYLDGEIASFCIVDDMGTHTIDGETLKIAGPGCVGTLHKYRKMGIGLTMVSNVTKILKDEGYDISYIHYTGVSDWYKKLGYITTLRWNADGPVKE